MPLCGMAEQTNLTLLLCASLVAGVVGGALSSWVVHSCKRWSSAVTSRLAGGGDGDKRDLVAVRIGQPEAPLKHEASLRKCTAVHALERDKGSPPRETSQGSTAPQQEQQEQQEQENVPPKLGHEKDEVVAWRAGPPGAFETPLSRALSGSTRRSPERRASASLARGKHDAVSSAFEDDAGENAQRCNEGEAAENELYSPTVVEEGKPCAVFRTGSNHFRTAPSANAALLPTTLEKRERFARFRECCTVEDFKMRLRDLSTCTKVAEIHAFYLQFELPSLRKRFPLDTAGVSRVDHFDANVAAMVQRVQYLSRKLAARARFVSAPYIGKTASISIASRFSNHKQKVKGLPAAVVMLPVALVSDEAVPPPLQANRMRGVDLTLKYEEALVEELKRQEVPMFDDASIGGGGRANVMSGVGILYALFVVASDAAFDMAAVHTNVLRIKARRGGVVAAALLDAAAEEEG